MSIPDIFAGNDDLLARVQTRHKDDVDRVSAAASLQDLLNYSDFSDSNNLLQKHKGHVPSAIQAQLSAINDAVGALAPVRNRVMHTRPLHFDDLASTLDRANELLNHGRVAPIPCHV
jgi:hypothetical protein